jgi:hypothetical protein
LIPGAALTGAAVSSLQCLFMTRFDSRRARIILAALALPLWVMGTLALGPVLLGDADFALSDLLRFLWSSALLPFGILLPWALTTAYILRTERPRWWRTGLLAAGATLAGAVLWLLLGIAVGAETD